MCHKIRKFIQRGTGKDTTLIKLTLIAVKCYNMLKSFISTVGRCVLSARPSIWERMVVCARVRVGTFSKRKS